MPSFRQEDLAPKATFTVSFADGDVYVHFESPEDKAAFSRLLSSQLRGGQTPAQLGREWFSKLVEQDVTAGLASSDRKRTQSIWWPEAEIGHFAGKSFVADPPRVPQYPIYIPSRGRHESRLTMKMLDKLGVPFYVVVEPQERDLYLRAGEREKDLLTLPESGRGLVYVRNWIWDHAESTGTPYFWTMDDNIMGLYRLQDNLKTPVGDGTVLRAAEDMATRYDNVGIAGLNYFMFASRKTKMPPVYINSRVYSNMLLRTDYREEDGRPFRNDPALRFNDDTDLNLRVLKRGHCTLLFNAFLIFKAPTMTVKGGMDYKRSEVKEEDHRWIASEQLRQKHPDVTKVVQKWGRWHHSVDYSSFRRNQLRLRPGVTLPEGVDEYGMTLRVEERPASPKAVPVPPPVLDPEVARGMEEAARKFAEAPPSTAPVVTVQAPLLSTLRRSAMPVGWKPDPFPDLRGVDEVGYDTETTGLRWWDGDRPVGVALSWRRGEKVESCYLPFRHAGGGNHDEETVKRFCNVELAGKRLVGLNAPFDVHQSQEWGFDPEERGCTVADVGHRAALLDDSRRSYSLESIARDELGEGKVDSVRAASMLEYGAWEVTPYARKDAELVLRVLDKQRPRLAAEELERVVALEDAVIYVSCAMERAGSPLDAERAARWERESAVALQLASLEVTRLCGRHVNPDSPEDMARLFHDRGIEAKVFTPTGRPSFTAEVLDELAKTDDAVGAIQREGRLKDLRSKFLVPYARAGALMRYQLNQLKTDEYGTVSGRYSSSQPVRGEGMNIQQVVSVIKQLRMYCRQCQAAWDGKSDGERMRLHFTSHPELFIVRQLHVAGSGVVFSADAKQVEFRIFASLTESPRLIKAYRDNPETDFHDLVSEFVKKFRQDLERKRVKNVNFGKLFGAGLDRLAVMLGCSREKAKEFVDFYDKAFPEAKTLMRKAMTIAEQRGYVKTLLGRRARFPGKQRLHSALNRAIQGNAADENKLKLLELYRERRRLGLTLRITNHDEVVGDAPDARAAAGIKEVLERKLLPTHVPLLWDVKTGPSWAGCEK